MNDIRKSITLIRAGTGILIMSMLISIVGMNLSHSIIGILFIIFAMAGFIVGIGVSAIGYMERYNRFWD